MITVFPWDSLGDPDIVRVNLCAELACGTRRGGSEAREGLWSHPDTGLHPDAPDLSCHTRKGHQQPCLVYLSAVLWGLGD